MEKSEISEIIQELIDSPEIFKQSIEVYKKLPNDHPNKKKLGTAIKNAKEAAIKLDVYLEDLIWSMESEKIRALYD